MTHLLIQYSYLQLLDLLTTMAFLLHGIQEANPLVRWYLEMSSSPIWGLLVVKAVALALGILVWRMGKRRLLARVNIFFAAVVTWNLVAVILGRAAAA